MGAEENVWGCRYKP